MAEKVDYGTEITECPECGGQMVETMNGLECDACGWYDGIEDEDEPEDCEE